MNRPIRAGGHVLCDSGWEPVDSPAGRAAIARTTAAVDETAETSEPAMNVDTGQETPPGEPLPEVEPVEPVVLLEPEREPIELEPAETVDFDTHPDRAECPDCGKNVAVNKDGSLRKHRCIEGDDSWRT